MYVCMYVCDSCTLPPKNEVTPGDTGNNVVGPEIVHYM